jgi:hypothetical protein
VPNLLGGGFVTLVSSTRQFETLRFFLQPRDRIQLEQIEQLYRDVPLPDEDRRWVTENLGVLNAFVDRATEFTVDGQAITNRMVLETFVYGDHAHANDEKRAEYQKWRSGLEKVAGD